MGEICVSAPPMTYIMQANLITCLRFTEQSCSDTSSGVGRARRLADAHTRAQHIHRHPLASLGFAINNVLQV